jgi:hypothetical protein
LEGRLQAIQLRLLAVQSPEKTVVVTINSSRVEHEKAWENTGKTHLSKPSVEHFWRDLKTPDL